jgi:hypothetical protein
MLTPGVLDEVFDGESLFADEAARAAYLADTTLSKTASKPLVLQGLAKFYEKVIRQILPGAKVSEWVVAFRCV